MRSPAQSAARDRARASVVKWCAPCGARKKDCRYCHYCRADRCPACRLIGRYSGPARCACCGKRPATWYLVAGRKVCMGCRPAALLLHAQQCMLSWRTDAAGRRALCKKHVALRCDIYVVWDDECLFIAIRLVLYVRHGRWLGLLDKSSLSYRGKDDALEILTSYLRSLLPKLPKKAVLLVLSSQQLEPALRKRFGGRVKCFEKSISKQRISEGFKASAFLKEPEAFDRTPLVKRAADLLAASGLESRGVQRVTPALASFLFPPPPREA